MIDLTNKKCLEKKFADDFSTPYFPMLAEIYLLEGNLTRAKKVCEVGLDYDDNNIDGKFLLAKVAVAEQKLNDAEKLLKKIIVENPAHFNALRLLITIEIQLQRSKNTIKNYINKILQFIPNDTQCLKWLEKIHVSENQIDNQNIDMLNQSDSKIIQENKKISFKEAVDYKIVESMATFTMVQVLKNQKHYNQALAVLDRLKSMGKNNERIVQERKAIEKILKEIR